MVEAIGGRVPVPPAAVERPPPSREFAQVMARAAAAAPAREAPGAFTGILQGVAEGQREMDRIIRLAQTGRTFTPAQLIGLQARVYRLSQELDLVSKLIEKATSGVKQAMSTQV